MRKRFLASSCVANIVVIVFPGGGMGTTGIDGLVEEAIERARSGQPTVLDLEGHAGYGKTHLARQVARQFDAAQVLRATAYPGLGADPLSLLGQLGVDVAGVGFDALSASRALGSHIEAQFGDGPCVVLLDDLHWADPESIDAVGVLMDRMAGNRLLVVAGHRPSGTRHARWLFRLKDVPSVVRVRLDGLDEAATGKLVRAANPSASPELVSQLRRHTGGSPLFINSLLHEYSLAELEGLARREALPAPAALIAAIGERLSRSDHASVATLSALAVLGGDGAESAVIRSVAEVHDTTGALDLLIGDGIVIEIREGSADRYRIFHAVVQSAVYDNIPVVTRSRMHAIAAARLATPDGRLRHRVAAAMSFDDGLAEDLQAFAEALHARGRYREAARIWRDAVRLSTRPERVSAYELEADIDAILARDVDDPSLNATDVPLDARSHYVLGAKLAVEKDFVGSSDALAAITDDDLDRFDPANAYRARVWRAWSFANSGRSPRAAMTDLERADAATVKDPALRGHATIAAGQISLRLARKGDRQTISALLSVDRTELASSPEGFMRLGWRGAVLSLSGMTREAISDLQLLTGRFADGGVDFTDGVFHALQAFAHFMNGQWPRCAILIGMSRAGRLQHASVLTTAIEPLAAVVSGDVERARAQMDHARRLRIRAPQPGAIHAGDMVEVLTLFLLGDDDSQRTWLDRRNQDFGSPDIWVDYQVPHLWYVTQAIGAQWADRPDEARRWIDMLRVTDPMPWAAAVADWLNARMDDTAERDSALARLAPAGIPELPTVNALLQFDVARRGVAGDEQRTTAIALLRSLGARHLAEQLFAPSAAEAAAAGDRGFLSALTDRERDVAALILEGLTYAQVAKELFITRSTVTFHVARIYAKTGTTSRQEFIQAARSKR